jgi:hypothetical protein
MFRLWTLLVGLPLCAAAARDAGPAADAPAAGAAAIPAGGSTSSATTLSGVLQWRGLPPLQWSIETTATPALARRVEGKVRVAADGLSGAADIVIDVPSGEIAWKEGQLQIELARWIPSLLTAAQMPPLPTGVTLEGALTAKTAGAWTARGLTGQADVQVRGSLERVTPALRVDGIVLALTLPNLSDLGDSPAQTARFARAKIGEVVAENAEIRFRIRSLQAVDIDGAELSLLGGRVRAEPFPLRIESAGLEPVLATLTLENLALAEAIKLLPQAVTAATGTIAGSVDVQWSREQSLTIGRGILELRPGRRAEMRLAPQPGFLTSQLPERLALLPPSFGPIARWFSPLNPAYAAVEAIELGRESLVIESLQVLTHPEADAAGRTARLQVRARPAIPGPVGEVSFEVNLSGPLNQVLKLGLDERVQMPSTGALDPAEGKRNIR